MSRNSVGNVFRVSALLCLVCSLVVSTAAVGLKSFQEANKLREKQKNVLLAAGLVESDVANETITEVYKARVRPEIIDLETGKPVEEGETVESDGEEITVPAEYDQRAAERSEDLTVAVDESARREFGYPIPREVRFAEIYLIKAEGEDESIEQIVLPIRGKGLWSTMYGFLALKFDPSKSDPSERYVINGITYYEQGETPGLGGEVENEKWKKQWDGKVAYNSDWDPQISVDKGGSGESHIDALAGATITSNGVQSMVNFWLSKYGFRNYLESLDPDQKSQTASLPVERN
ncbi:Na(+)-translocating NADH-quinone reductase subunit C [Stratiformator vulcanicus]|uniref:Na(+)-translocating NADH-quinone reductase subunit C n=1 Tax=Stratiformator vulcanicus TaxID=2527980 RepID=A0A517QW13_9PLAN|nr:Na(+)-translocating NADH-quinone reductase subunit C [Stratiformator vulcanicus]QDT35855.1 Na(+)-translocating NADH-quinone reductase subunit C [Stratiformator vulcanicus]